MRGEDHVEVDLDLVAELEGAKERRVGPDSPTALDDGRPTNDPAIGHTTLQRDGVGHTHDRQLTVAGERRHRPVDPPGPEGDGWVLAGVEDLLEGLVDLCTVSNELAGVAGSTVARPCQRVTSMERSWPALAPSPVRVVWTKSRPDSGPNR